MHNRKKVRKLLVRESSSSKMSGQKEERRLVPGNPAARGGLKWWGTGGKYQERKLEL